MKLISFPLDKGSKILIPESYGGFFELLSEDGKATRSFENVLELSRRRNIRVLVRESFVVRSSNSSKTLHAGEILTPLSDNGKVLQCRTSKNLLINLPLDCKAKFSPIATKEDSISGVHSVSQLNIAFWNRPNSSHASSLAGEEFTSKTNATNCSLGAWLSSQGIKIRICARITIAWLHRSRE